MFFGDADPAREPRPRDPRPVRRRRGGEALNHQLGVDRPLIYAVRRLDRRLRDGRHGQVVSPCRPGRGLLVRGVRALAEARPARVHIVVPLSIFGGVVAALHAAAPPTARSRSAACRRRRCRSSSSGDLPDRDLRARPRLVPVDRPGRRARASSTQIKYLFLPALCARARALRLHRPDGARRHDRGARRPTTPARPT